MCFSDGLRKKGSIINSTEIDFDGKGNIFMTMMSLVPDCECKRAPGKDDFNLFWTKSNGLVCLYKILGLIL